MSDGFLMCPLPEKQPDFTGKSWSLAILSSREGATQLTDVVLNAANADRNGASLVIDVLINGNPRLAAEVRGRLSASWWKSGTTIRLWSVARPDKAYTWNYYLHTLLPESEIVFFLDGYVTVEADAFVRMADALHRRPEALAASCVPSSGRSADKLRRRALEEGGGFHGNLYALPGSTTRLLRNLGFRLPTGIYRNDSALGAALAFNLDPSAHPWRWDRIVLVPEARYRVPPIDVRRVADVAGILKRRFRQARGDLETRALRSHLDAEQRPPSQWAATATELVLRWAEGHRAEARSLFWTHPLAWAALIALRRRGDVSLPSDSAECVGIYTPSVSTSDRATAAAER